MKTLLPANISTVDQAKEFINNLLNNGECYHFDDDAKDVLFDDGTYFSESEAIKLNILMNEIYLLPNFDPFEYVLLLIEEADSINI